MVDSTPPLLYVPRRDAERTVREWMRGAAAQRRMPVLMVVGASGAGKTQLVRAAAAELTGVRVEHIGSDASSTLARKGAAAEWLDFVRTRTFEPTILFLDDADSLTANAGSDARVGALVALARSSVPVVVATCDAYATRQLRELYTAKDDVRTLVTLALPSVEEIGDALCEFYGGTIGDARCRAIAARSDGDVRRATTEAATEFRYATSTNRCHECGRRLDDEAAACQECARIEAIKQELAERRRVKGIVVDVPADDDDDDDDDNGTLTSHSSIFDKASAMFGIGNEVVGSRALDEDIDAERLEQLIHVHYAAATAADGDRSMDVVAECATRLADADVLDRHHDAAASSLRWSVPELVRRSNVFERTSKRPRRLDFRGPLFGRGQRALDDAQRRADAAASDFERYTLVARPSVVSTPRGAPSLDDDGTKIKHVTTSSMHRVFELRDAMHCLATRYSIAPGTPMMSIDTMQRVAKRAVASAPTRRRAMVVAPPRIESVKKARRE